MIFPGNTTKIPPPKLRIELSFADMSVEPDGTKSGV